MEILCFCKVSPLAPQLGGAELRAWECMRRWAREGHRVAVVSGRTSRDQPVGLHCVDGVEVHVLPTLPSQLFRWHRASFLASRGVAYLRSAAFFPRGHWDIIRDDMSPLPSFYPLHAKRTGVASVLVVHILFGGPGEWTKIYGPLGVVGAFAEAALVRGWLPAKRIISASGWLADRLRVQTDTPVDWIPNGVDIERFSPRRPAESDDCLRIISVGRFGPLPKGQADLVEAVARLAYQDIPVRVTFVGEGPERPNIENLAQGLGVAELCTFLGAVGHEQMPDQYRAHEVFVLSSYSEGLPLTFLEAMATGLAIVSTNIIAVRELAAASQALVYEPGDVGALASHLALLARSPERRQAMGGGARLQAVRQFSWDQTAASEMRVFQQLLQR